MTASRPFSSYRVVEIASGAGAFCARVLADLGASVEKFEPKPGDPMRHQAPQVDGVGISFLWYNARKRCQSIDLGTVSGRELVLSKLVDADVFVDGYPPGWLEARGLSPAELRRRFPKLIVASVTDFGQTGPYRDWNGSALVDFAMSGSLLRCGLPDEAPCGPPYQLPYAISGVAAAFATGAALWNRERTGEGDWIDCSTFEALTAQADWSVPGYSATGQQQKRSGAGPLFRLYKASDGWVRVINLSVKQWRAVQAWLGNPPDISGPEWDNPLFRAAHMDVQERVFDPAFRYRTVRDLFEDGQSHGVGIVPVYAPSEVVADPHFSARQAFIPFPLPNGGRATAPAGFVRMDSCPPEAYGPAASPEPESATLRTPTKLGLVSGPPLVGVRVVEVGSGAVGPEIARVLGILGADVVKLESRSQLDFMRLQGADIESSPAWSSSSRNKRSVELDLKTESGRELAQRLVGTADVVVENNTSGVMERLGLGYEAMSKKNPKLVYLSSQAFGASGPYASYGGFGPTNQAISGTSYLWNHAEPERPEGVQVIHPDHILGRMGGLAVIAALDEVRREGRGQHIDLGQAEFATACIGEAFIQASLGVDVSPCGNASPLGAPYGVFPCAGDDQWIAITIESEEHWKALKAIVGEPSWDDPEFDRIEGRVRQRDLIEAQLSAWTSQAPPVQLQRRLQMAGIPAGALYSVAHVASDVHLHARGFLRTVSHPKLGSLWMEGPGFLAERMELMPEQRAPLFGEHTAEVIEEWLGLPSSRSSTAWESASQRKSEGGRDGV